MDHIAVLNSWPVFVKKGEVPSHKLIPIARKVIRNSEGGGGWKAKRNYEAKLELVDGWGEAQCKILPLVGYRYTHILKRHKKIIITVVLPRGKHCSWSIWKIKHNHLIFKPYYVQIMHSLCICKEQKFNNTYLLLYCKLQLQPNLTKKIS